MGKNFNDVISALKKIRKEQLDERTFYTQVLLLIKELDGVRMTRVDFKILKDTLLEIGCQRFSDWKKEKLSKGERVEEGSVGSGMSRATIETAVSFVSQLLSDYENASFSLPYMLDGGEEYGWLQTWVRNNKLLYGQTDKFKFEEEPIDKSKIPYYIVAKQALMNWNGLSEEEADKIINEQTLEEIDGQVWAKGSMDSALRSIVSNLGLSEEEARMLNEVTYTGVTSDNKKVIETIREKVTARGTSTNSVIMDTLFAVHDGWVESNAKKFLAREKKHQHMPSELIGWKEAKADLLFIKPIFEALGYTVSEEELEKEYEKRVYSFFLNLRIRNEEDLALLISRGDEFYPALSGQKDNIEYLKDREKVRTVIIPQIEEKGIGNISKKRQSILDEISITVRDEDLIRLSEIELAEIEMKLTDKINRLERKDDYNSEVYLATKIRLHKVSRVAEVVRKRSKTNNSEEE